MKSKLYTLEELNSYVAAMKSISKSLGVDYALIINTPFIEMWDCLDGESYFEEKLMGSFYTLRDLYVEENDLDFDILALSFIKSGEFDEFLDSST